MKGLSMKIPVIYWFLAPSFLYANIGIASVEPKLNQQEVNVRADFVGKWETKYTTSEGEKTRVVANLFDDSRYIMKYYSYSADNEPELVSQKFGLWGDQEPCSFRCLEAGLMSMNLHPQIHPTPLTMMLTISLAFQEMKKSWSMSSVKASLPIKKSNLFAI
jgi:hypothetical protein